MLNIYGIKPETNCTSLSKTIPAPFNSAIDNGYMVNIPVLPARDSETEVNSFSCELPERIYIPFLSDKSIRVFTTLKIDGTLCTSSIITGSGYLLKNS